MNGTHEASGSIKLRHDVGMPDPLVQDLREQIASGDALLVVGTGVSIAATSGAHSASWIGLLRDGIARVEALRPPGLPDSWATLTRERLESNDLEWLLSVAEDITVRLGGQSGGEFRRWLKDSIGALNVVDSTVIDALLDLGSPIATTNYDGLLEQASGRVPVTWRDGARMRRVLRGDAPGILHLHGYWDDPESVALGVRSYEPILGNAAAQALQQAMATVRTLVFVGFGAGLADPNFGALCDWMSMRFSGSEYRHYRLCSSAERDSVASQHQSSDRIVPLVYGATHGELAGFMRGLSPGSRTPRLPVDTPGHSMPFGLPPARFCVGRDVLVDDVSIALTRRGAPVVVLGAPGIGKSTVCLAALHDDRVAAQFGGRRWLVRCEGASSASELLSAIATELGVTVGRSSGSLLDTVLAEFHHAPGLVVLDNLETPWAHDPLQTERLLGHFGTEPHLTLAAAVRGMARPGGVRWKKAVTVLPLDHADSRVVFLASIRQ